MSSKAFKAKIEFIDFQFLGLFNSVVQTLLQAANCVVASLYARIDSSVILYSTRTTDTRRLNHYVFLCGLNSNPNPKYVNISDVDIKA